MRSRVAQTAVALAWVVCIANAGWAESAAPPSLARHVEYLASEALGGRMTGSAGERQAAEYIARELQEIGAQPLEGHDGFLWPFEFKAGLGDGGSSLELAVEGDTKPRSWTGNDRIQALSFSDNGRIEGEVVFAGYGLSMPESEELAYDSYAGLDVENKIVLVLRYVPEDLDPDKRSLLARYAGLRYKALYARERGAKAILILTGPRSPNAGETIPMTFDAALSGSGILAASIGGEIGSRLFRSPNGQTLEQVQAELDTGNPHISGFDIPGVRVALDVRVKRDALTGHNVIGILPAGAQAASRGASDGEFVMLGAHLDHLGQGNHGNSLARKDDKQKVHKGADDNASGVTAVLRAGEILAGRELRRPVILAFWSGEEIGLLGSGHFVKQAPVPTERLLAYLNFDMVGRMRDNRLVLKGIGSSSVWPGLVERSNVSVGFDIRTNSDPYVPTDATSLYLAGVPTLDFFTGAHEDYHRPTDEAAKLNYEDLERVARFGASLAAKLAAADERPDYVKVTPKSPPGARASLRVFTGTIPDYATEVDGLRLSGVIAGGPAEQAGLREGDVIVEFGGLRITNIYDYTNALERARIGEPIQVIFERDGKRAELTITPSARK